jgi:prolyl oligopeptidase
MFRPIRLSFRLALLAALPLSASAQGQSYPRAAKVDHVDDYFGTKVPDPYRWMEDDTASAVKAWVQAENAVTFAYLDKIPFRARLRARLEELYNYPRYSAPSHTGPYYVFSKNDGLQNQSVLYIQRGLEGAPELLLDPNALSSDGTVRRKSAVQGRQILRVWALQWRLRLGGIPCDGDGHPEAAA